MPTRAPWITVAVVCAAEILSMTPFSMFLALQPRLQDAWTLSNTVSGWISSAYFTGYMLAVPVLGGLTDRVDARRVWLGACALAGVGSLGFALLADGRCRRSISRGTIGWLPAGVAGAAACARGATRTRRSGAARTSGIVAVAPPASRGTAMAIYSTLGFAAASAGTFAVGLTLDLLGGQSVTSWAVAFAIMSLPNVVGALVLRRVTE